MFTLTTLYYISEIEIKLDFLHGHVVKNLFFILFSSFEPSTCGRTAPFGSIYEKMHSL